MRKVLNSVLFFALLGSAVAQLPAESLTVSGILEDSGGSPVVGPVSIELFIYDDAAGGSLLWSEVHASVAVDAGGRYRVLAGSSTPLGSQVFADPNTWLTLEVNGDGQMSPRMPLAKVPTAYNADRLDGSPATAFAANAALIDQDPVTSPVHWNDLTAVPAGFADGTDDVDDADADPANETNLGLVLNGGNLELQDAAGTLIADLTPLVDWGILSSIPAGFADGTDDVADADADPANETNLGLVLNGGNLELQDSAGTLIADLTPLVDWGILSNIPAGFADGIDDTVGPPSGPAGGHLAGSYPNPSVATGVIGTNQLANSSVTNGKIVDSAISNSKIGNGQVFGAKIATGAVTSDKIASMAVTQSKLASQAVTTLKIADAAVASNKIATGAVTGGKIADASIFTTKLLDNVITEAKIANSAVTTDKLANSSVTGTKIAAAAVSGAKIQVDSIDSTKILDGSIAAADLAPPGFADGIDNVDDADASPTNEHNTSVALNGTDLEVTDGGGTISTDLGVLTGGVTTEVLRVTVPFGGGPIWMHPTWGWSVEWSPFLDTLTVVNPASPVTGFLSAWMTVSDGAVAAPVTGQVINTPDGFSQPLAVPGSQHGFRVVVNDTDPGMSGFILEGTVIGGNVNALVRYW